MKSIVSTSPHHGDDPRHSSASEPAASAFASLGLSVVGDRAPSLRDLAAKSRAIARHGGYLAALADVAIVLRETGVVTREDLRALAEVIHE